MERIRAFGHLIHSFGTLLGTVFWQSFWLGLNGVNIPKREPPFMTNTYVSTVLILASFFVSSSAVAQVTNGKSPGLPAPFATKSAGNPPEVVKAPAGFLPKVPDGFRVNVFATGFKEPRYLTVAPNGDVFLADSGAGKIYILRDPQNTGGSQQREEFASGMNRPFGIVFREGYVYVGNVNSLVRFAYDPKTSKRMGAAQKLIDLPNGGHNTRSLAFTPDGKHLLIGVGSESNASTGEDERRAAVNICDLDGKNLRQYSTGLRNPVGLAIEPNTGKAWVTVNERDGLGDDLPPDFFTSIEDGGFYGWPYSYIGSNVDPRVKPQKPELVSKATVPDVLLGAHRAPLEFAFYTGKQFPEKYRGGAFIAEHGSWNRAPRAGYEVAFVQFRDGKAVAGPEDFLTGLVPDAGKESVYGRPVGITVATDGSLLVADDGANVIYRVSVAK
jgi:glucose/arabinose dehydrogenase